MSEQGTPDWHAKRAGKFTGSRMHALFTKGRGGKPSATRRELIVSLAVERIRGEYLESFSSPDMRRGKELEEDARQAYERKHGVLVIEEDFVIHPDLPFVGVSPDGLVGDDGMIELKCYNTLYKHADALLLQNNDEEHFWQTQSQLWVCRRQWCDVISFDPRWPEKLQLAETRVYSDINAQTQLDLQCNLAEQEVLDYIEKLTKLKETQ